MTYNQDTYKPNILATSNDVEYYNDDVRQYNGNNY